MQKTPFVPAPRFILAAILTTASLAGPGAAAARAQNGTIGTDVGSFDPPSLAVIDGAKPHAPKRFQRVLKEADAATADAAETDGVPGRIDATRRGRAWGSFGIPYTSTRVWLGPSTRARSQPNYLATTYPYRTVGRLTFLAGGFSSFCSASVIARGIIVTAAHCVQAYGSGSSLYTNHVFAPAYYGAGAGPTQRTPYGLWTAKAIQRPATWASGTDTGTGDGSNNDLALIAVAPRASRFVGDVVGQLGYGWNNYSFYRSAKTGNKYVGAVTTLGYPGLLDGGGILQRTDGPTFLTLVGGAKQYWQGSDFTGGSSGGPWVVNFYSTAPVRTGGGQAGNESERYVVGVTSWGSADPNDVKDNYSSRFGQNREFPAANYGGRGAGNIGALVDALCQRTVPGAGRTFAEAGYCD